MTYGELTRTSCDLIPPDVRPEGSALDVDGAGLAQHLRARTRASHVATERAFDLESRVAGRGPYVDLLLLLRGFYGPAERSLADVGGWDLLTPAIDVAGWCRAGLLDDDLRRLGVPPADVTADPQDVAVVRSVEEALGTVYVLAGSALGGRTIARRARERLGAALPVTFFTRAGGPALGPAWRALQAGLDGYGAGASTAAGERVVRAARQTFEAMGARLTALPVEGVPQPVR